MYMTVTPAWSLKTLQTQQQVQLLMMVVILFQIWPDAYSSMVAVNCKEVQPLSTKFI